MDNRRSFIKMLGLGGLASLIPASLMANAKEERILVDDDFLTTNAPYYEIPSHIKKNEKIQNALEKLGSKKGDIVWEFKDLDRYITTYFKSGKATSGTPIYEDGIISEGYIDHEGKDVEIYFLDGINIYPMNVVDNPFKDEWIDHRTRKLKSIRFNKEYADLYYRGRIHYQYLYLTYGGKDAEIEEKYEVISDTEIDTNRLLDITSIGWEKILQPLNERDMIMHEPPEHQEPTQFTIYGWKNLEFTFKLCSITYGALKNV